MIELKNISFQVEGNKEILKDISLTIHDDEFTVLTGPNGGGKSTLAKLLAGIETPTSGQILFDGQDITRMSITDRARLGISYAFQQPVRFKGITVYDLIRLATGNDELTRADACQYLSQVGLCANDYIGRTVDERLSGGELKRIEIATVIARAKRLSIFDEPEAGIDLWSFGNLIRVFERLHEKIDNAAILIISHQERIIQIADRVIVLSGGQVVANGPRDEVLPALNGAPGQGMCNRLAEEVLV